MEEKKHPLKKSKVEIRRAPNALKIILILLILFSTAALVALRWVHNGITAEIQKMKDEAAAIEYANDELKEKTENIDNIQNIQGIAQEEKGLVDPDAVIIDPQ